MTQTPTHRRHTGQVRPCAAIRQSVERLSATEPGVTCANRCVFANKPHLKTMTGDF